MHDPLTMAFRIRVPRLTPKPHAWSLASRWLSTVATVWHRDPSGHDDITCKPTHHLRHPHHWRLQVNAWQSFRRRWLDRCAWCGKGTTKGDPVNNSHTWDPPRRPWWRHTDCFHRECSAIERAHRMCTCSPRWLGFGESGTCAACGKFAPWRRAGSPDALATEILASIPAGQRDALKYATVKALWANYEAQRKESRDSADDR